MVVAIGIVVLIAGLSATITWAAGAGFWSEVVLEVQTIQRDLHRQLATAIQAVQAKGMAASWALVTLSFLYGVFHAAGPGHGKIVISTYILTNESQLRRGLLLSISCSLCQGLTAIVAVDLTAGLLGFTLRQAQSAATDLETITYGLVALLGLTLILSRARRLYRRLGNSAPNLYGHLSQSRPEQHRHGAPCPSCNHGHGPSRQDLDTPLSWTSFAGMVTSVGLRPCSGAVLVLLVAYSLDLRWAGIGAVLAMSLGTAITVSLLATLSVYARKGALQLASLIPLPTVRLAAALDLVAVLGGLVILIAGILMLQSALFISAHPLL
tara:strand:+ start:87 stop:1058 length:972 start_codon:yes stop_codon:yes gene_type:complete